MKKKTAFKILSETIWDFISKCMNDHVGPFGAMAAFFTILSFFPFMIFFFTLTRHIHYFTMEDLVVVVERALSFENSSFVRGIIREIYAKTNATVSIVSIITALWTSSKGAYTIIIGLNSVYDIEERRNYLVLRLLGVFYTLIFGLLIILMLVVWVFGSTIKNRLVQNIPELQHILSEVLSLRLIYTMIIMTVLFMLIYQFIPKRRSFFLAQFPGAFITSCGWMVISWAFSLFVQCFTSFNYLYGSMAGIMLLLLWLYWCMSMVFYGAEINYFLENRQNYHRLISVLRPRWERQRRMREKELWAFTYQTRKRKFFNIFRKGGIAGEFDRNFEDYIDKDEYEDHHADAIENDGYGQRGKNYVQDGSASD